MSGFPSFAKIAPYLANPLVLIGFALLLFFGVHRALIKSKILPAVSPTASNRIVRLILHYGFVVALVLILCGFGFATYQAYLNSRGKNDLSSQAQHEFDRLQHLLLTEFEVSVSLAMPISGDGPTPKETQKLYRYIERTLSPNTGINAKGVPANLLPDGYDSSIPSVYMFKHKDCDSAYANQQNADLELTLPQFVSLSVEALLHAKKPSLALDDTAMIIYVPSAHPPFGPMTLERDFKLAVRKTSGEMTSSKDVYGSTFVFSSSPFDGFALQPLSMSLKVANGVVLEIPRGKFRVMKDWEMVTENDFAAPVYCYTFPS